MAADAIADYFALISPLMRQLIRLPIDWPVIINDVSRHCHCWCGTIRLIISLNNIASPLPHFTFSSFFAIISFIDCHCYDWLRRHITHYHIYFGFVISLMPATLPPSLMLSSLLIFHWRCHFLASHTLAIYATIDCLLRLSLRHCLLPPDAVDWCRHYWCWLILQSSFLFTPFCRW